MRSIIFWLPFLLLLPFLSVNYNIQATHSLSASNSSKHLCHHKDSTALLHFARDFAINSSASKYCYYLDQTSYPKIRSWKGNTDCCSWDGVSCDSLSGHVIKLDLSCGQIVGTIDSNSSLFQLQQLQSLNLAFNDFRNSTISPKIGKFSHLRYLNLSSAGFSGIVPTEIANLSQLISLDLEGDWLKLSDLALITDNMTGLTQLHLGFVSIVNSAVPPSLAKLTSLSSLVLQRCGLQGNFPLAEILHFPHIRNLVIQYDYNLHADFSRVSWIDSLEVLHLSSLNFTGKLPKSPGPTQFLRELNLSSCNFYGVIPPWVWNTTESIDLSNNQFSGELPSLLNTSKLSKIASIKLISNKLSGKIPPWLFTLPSLLDLSLSDNQFSGELVIENFNPSRSSWDFDLSTKYKVYESNRTLTSGATNLQSLYLGSNKLNGTIDFSVFYKFPNLTTLLLSNNSLSLSFNDDTPTQPPQIRELYLSSCNLGKFPNFLIDQDQLERLNLSNSKIHGQVPLWFLEKESLTCLDLSHNYLTGGLENIPWHKMETIDLSYNMFKGLLPSTICNSNLLEFLDLSKNSLTGHIPRCLGNFSDKLIVLNLRLNKFQGTLPPNFTKCGSLKYMYLNRNKFEGRVPSSLSSCLSLEVLDLGNNMLSGEFPLWLSNLTELKALVLRSNWFKGPLSTEQDVESPFPKLHILDVANNRLSGNWPHKLVNSLKCMMNKGGEEEEQYISDYYTETVLDYNQYMLQYMFSTELTIKGSYRNVDKVLSDPVAIDLSSNMFEGDIPTAIGDLVLLRWLNLSHNNFSGTIPSSLSNLVVLKSLDISSNELVGQIPKELGILTSLEVFNVSRNQLAGPIPIENQFTTFESGSYLDNAGLCGIPLSKKCGTDGDAATEPPPTVYHDFADISIWEVVLMGYGCGMVFGLVIGCFVSLVRTPFWVLRLMSRVEFIMEQHSKRWRRRLV